MEDAPRARKAIISKEELDKGFGVAWMDSGVEDAYADAVNEKLDELIEYLRLYDPIIDVVIEEVYLDSIKMMVYTFTELLARLCAGGLAWKTTDKARFLSPTVDVEQIIRSRTPLTTLGRVDISP